MPHFRTAALAALSLAAAWAAAADKDAKPAVLFNGADLSGWKVHGDEAKSKWVVGRAVIDDNDPKKLAVTPFPPGRDGGPAPLLLINAANGVDLYTEEKFGDCHLEVEFMVPKESNSGVYLMGEYEVQILDSFGKDKPDKGDVGAVYGVSAPKVNAAKKPGEWQRFVIDFQAPRFDSAGKKTANAKFLKVVLNDQVVQEDVEVPGPTLAGMTGKEAATGPLMLQGDHGPVAFRNIKLTKVPSDK